MKKLLATTAIATVAFGHIATAEMERNAFEETNFDVAQNLNASNLIGMFVYTAENGVGATYVDGGADGQEWENIGDINEIVLTRSGEVESVIVGVGGFLGMGERDVAIDMSALQFVSDGEGSDEFFLVVEASRLEVEEAPEYTPPTSFIEQADMETPEDADMSEGTMTADASTEIEDVDQITSEDVASMTDETGAPVSDSDMNQDTMTAEASEEMMETGDQQMAATNAMAANEQEDGMGDRMVSRDDLTAEALTGTSVFGPNDENLGEISELLLGTDGAIDQAIVDVGGFLGLGEYSVALNFDELDITIEGEDDLRVSVPMTQEELEAMPEYTG